MMTLRELIDVFTGAAKMDYFAGKKIELVQGLMEYARVFLIVAVLLVIESVIFRLGSGLLGGEPLVDLAIGVGLILVLALVLIPVVLIVEYIAILIWGTVHFYLARFFSNKPETIADFNGSLLTLFSAIKLVGGLLFLIPLLGWFASGIVCIYGVFLMFKFVKAKFNLTDSQGLIVTLVPLCIILGVAAIVSFIAFIPVFAGKFL